MENRNRNNRNRNNRGNQAPDNQNKNNRRRPGASFVIMVTLVVAILVLALFQFGGSDESNEITYDEFLRMVDDGEVAKVEIESDRLVITGKEEDEYGYAPEYYTGLVYDESLSDRLYDAGVEYYQEVPDTTGTVILNVLLTLLPIALIVVMFVWMTRRMSSGGGLMGVGRSNAKKYEEMSTGVTFADVAGQDEAKESLQEVVDFLHHPDKYTSVGAKLPKGALLVGPPGTGKTLLAKAVAGEAKVPFFSLTGSEFVEMYVGVGASRVRDLFKQAQEAAPCIVFIDEIDAIGKSRDNQMGSNDEREQTLNQLLSEMDGFEANKGLVLLAATNRPEVLDPALLRPGRFDRRIVVEKPDLKGRIDTLKVHSKDVRMDETVDLEAIALATSGAVGSDLANMINEAAINAVQHGRNAVSQGDLFEAVEQVLVGKEKKDRIMSQEERQIVSYHEVGHALVSALQKDAEPVQKITIVPRTMGALGYVMQTPEEEKYLNTKNELEAMLVSTLAGRAAEEIAFNTVTTGAANDIEHATEIARAMVTQYGMSEKFGLIGLESIQNKYLDGRPVMNCGEETASEIDQEVMGMLKTAYDEAKALLTAHRKTLDKIAAYLIEKETITGKEFMKIFHECEGIDPDAAPKNEERIVMKPAEGTEEEAAIPDKSETSDETQPDTLTKEEEEAEVEAIEEEEAQDEGRVDGERVEDEPVAEEGPVIEEGDNGDGSEQF